MLDDRSAALFVKVPTENVILFQAFIELYDGVAAVRTVDRMNSILCLLTTLDFLEDCRAILDALQPELGWRIPEVDGGASWVAV
jgi:hypothetical protein